MRRIRGGTDYVISPLGRMIGGEKSEDVLASSMQVIASSVPLFCETSGNERSCNLEY